MDGTADVFEKFKRRLKQGASEEQKAGLKRWLTGPLAFIYRNNLKRLAQIYCSDKWSHHWYCQHYERHFAPLRKKAIVLLEIGIGGYANPKSGGASLRMWRTWFPRGRIYGIDLEDKSPHNEGRIRTFRGDQSDEKFLASVIAEIGTPDIIIDDGSHLNDHVIKTFKLLFPLLADQGIYAVEDTQTAYWPEWGGNSEDLNCPATSMNLLKSLADGLNHVEFIRPGYVPSYFDKHIVSLHFYHNLVVICKGLNNEASEMIKNNAV